MKIDKSTALVTGANRGIGRAFVETLLEQGAARVYATARKPDSLEELVRTAPDRVIPLKLDVTDEESILLAAASANDVNLLINNAGVLAFADLLTGDMNLIRRDMETNYFGTLNMLRSFAPVLTKNSPGAVVNVLSVVSLANMPMIGGYSASKAAALSLTQGVRKSLSQQGVSVHGVFPGPIDTDMARDLDMPKASPRDVADAALAAVEAGEQDVFPDPMAKDVYSAWSSEPKALEMQFATM